MRQPFRDTRFDEQGNAFIDVARVYDLTATLVQRLCDDLAADHLEAIFGMDGDRT